MTQRVAERVMEAEGLRTMLLDALHGRRDQHGDRLHEASSLLTLQSGARTLPRRVPADVWSHQKTGEVLTGLPVQRAGHHGREEGKELLLKHHWMQRQEWQRRQKRKRSANAAGSVRKRNPASSENPGKDRRNRR